MNKNYHIFSDGQLERSNDTVRLLTADDDTKYLPVENAEAIFLHGQIDFNTRLISFLNDHGVAMHVFGWNDYYAGSIMPERGQTSGETLVQQVRAYEDEQHRLQLAQNIVSASIYNMRANLKYYDARDHDFSSRISELTATRDRVEETDDIEELLGIEATARRSYYTAFDAILSADFEFTTRQYNPPDNEVNSLISFANSLVYANCVSAIRATALDPAISYLHEPGERRYSLSLDLADIFKPLLADRTIFQLVNRSQITLTDFDTEMNACLLTEAGRKTLSKAFEETLERTIEHPSLKRKVSYQYLLRIEAYKLKKHLLTGEEYVPFERWW